MDEVARSLQELVETVQLAPDETATRTRGIYSAMRQDSPHLSAGNFTTIRTDDLQRLFAPL